jgi:hypothetical protein
MITCIHIFDERRDHKKLYNNFAMGPSEETPTSTGGYFILSPNKLQLEGLYYFIELFVL